MPFKMKQEQFSAMISSTALDLPEHRAAVKEACLAARVFPIGMEHLPARDASGVAVSLEMVDQADIYLGIYAWRYGWVPDGEDISVTEMEFDRAIKRQADGELREILIFSAHKDHACKVEDVEADKDAQKKLTAFKTKAAAGRVRQEYRSVEELRRLVTQALHEFLRREYEKPLQAYFKALSDNFSTYENLGLPPPANAEGEKDVRIAIRELFVEPTCTGARVSPEEFDAALLAGKNSAKPLLPLLAGEERRFVLLADPGMGKSTLIQWLITTLAEEAPLPAAAAGLRGAIPLPFILRDLVRHLPKAAKEWDWPALLKAFRSYHPRAADRPPLAAALTGDEAYFRTLLASERAFFLIDGLDEIGEPAHRRALRDALWQGFNQYPKARWLVTSRWVGYEEAEVHAAKLEASFSSVHGHGEQSFIVVSHAALLYLAPFDDLQQLTFARHWYLPRMGEVVGAEHAGRFVAAVRQNSAVRVIGRVPNLLYLLALLYRHRALLPHGRAHVYAAISEAYLGGMEFGIDAARGASGSTVGSIQATRRLQGGEQFKDKVRVLATIARHMQEGRAAYASVNSKPAVNVESEILVSRETLQRCLAPHFPGEGGRAALDAFIGYVAARSGLLLPRGEGLFGFAHLSFQEFYAACWLEEEFGLLLAGQDEAVAGIESEDDDQERATLTREQFAVLAAQPAWREPLVFLVEKLSASAAYTRTVIRWLFPLLHQPEPVAEEGQEPPELMPFEAARLLAALSLDPQVALTLKQRQIIWEKLWRTHLAQQSTTKWHLAPSLLVASDYQPQVWAALETLRPVKLILRGCTNILNLNPLLPLTSLEEIYQLSSPDVSDISPLANLTQLHTLYLERCTGVTNLAPLANLVHLDGLVLRDCTGVVNIAPLAGLIKLRLLDISGCTGVVELSPLAGIANLRTLHLTGCAGVRNLETLSYFTQLESLSIEDCSNVSDLTPLSSLTQLKRLYVKGCTGLSAEAVPVFRKSHPNAEVFGS